MAHHPWEIAHPWEVEHDSETDSEDDEWDPRKVSGEPAAKELLNVLLDLYFKNKLSAKMLAVICWWACRLGDDGSDIVKSYGYRPDAQSGRFQRHLDTVMKMDGHAKDKMKLDIPAHTKYDLARTTHSYAVTAPYEALESEVQKDPSLIDKLEAKNALGEWPNAFKNHLFYGRAGRHVFPCVLYVDGVPFTKRDGMIGFYFYNLVSSRRWLVVALRKSYLCKCGCRGWCTFWSVFNFITWCLTMSDQGAYPSQDWSQSDWTDEVRVSLAGIALTTLIALVFIKGDWAEYSNTFGLASWASKLYPCFNCWCVLSNMFRYQNVSLCELPWPEATDNDYDQACRACERWVILETLQMWRRVRANLVYDRTKRGSHGRALTCNIEPLQLLKGDRLEPCATMQDVALFDTAPVLPARVLFWRPSEETRSKHRNPLVRSDLGIGLHTFATDSLHTLNLGVLFDWVVQAIWKMIDSDVWGVGGTMNGRIEACILRFRNELFAWYPCFILQRPDLNCHRMEDFTPEMIGTRKRKKLKAKAAETKTLLYAVVAIFKKYALQIEKGSETLAAGEALVSYFDSIYACDMEVPLETINDVGRFKI